MPTRAPDGEKRPEALQASDDAARAIRFMLVKAAIFILVPLAAALIAVAVMLK